MVTTTGPEQLWTRWFLWWRKRLGIHVRPVTISLVLVGNMLFVMLLLEYYWCYICGKFREHLDTVSINSKTKVFWIILKKNYFLWIMIFLRFFRYLFLLTKNSQIYHFSKKILTTVNQQQVSQVITLFLELYYYYQKTALLSFFFKKLLMWENAGKDHHKSFTVSADPMIYLY